jgi:predicted HAD superfamily Cof-like phosphohydrolase
MHAIDQPVREFPGLPSSEKIIRLRAELILEEAFEFAFACFSGEGEVEHFVNLAGHARDAIRAGQVHVRLPDVADALADLTYVVEGAWLTYGIDPQPVIDEVHRTNLSKIGGPIHPETGKRQKPEGWKPPDIDRVLREQEWKP